MAGTITRRRAVEVRDDGSINYDDVPATWEEGERIAGRRLDRRGRYLIAVGEQEGEHVRQLVRWTQRCSGCDGGGCDECGHSGKVRVEWFAPLIVPLDDVG